MRVREVEVCLLLYSYLVQVQYTKICSIVKTHEYSHRRTYQLVFINKITMC